MNGYRFDQWTRLLAVAGLTLGLGLGLGGAVSARGANGSTATAEEQQPAFEEVKSFPVLRGPHSWQVLDDRTVIVWATAFQPYLVKLAFGSPDLRREQVIGVTSAGSRVYARFDYITVAGFRYPIDSIYKMTREEARSLVRQS